MRKELAWLIVAMVSIMALGVVMGQSEPLGATLTEGASSRGTNPSVENDTAQAGNVTAINFDQTRITDIWQGYFGNVSGSITLENSAGDSFYDWSTATVDGEVYATRNTVSDWSNVNCTNSTQWENEEVSLSIDTNSTDGVNETYSLQGGHPDFEVGTRPVSGCRATRPFNSTSESSDFWNVLINTDASNVVYTTLLSDDSDAFAGSTADFELLVPVNRSSTLSTYYFYVELI